MSDVEATVPEPTAELPPAAEVISEPDPIATALQTVELLRGKRLALMDRVSVNRRSSEQLSFDAFVNGGKARKSLDDLNAEAAMLDRELANLDSAIAESERRHREAIAAEAVKQERGRAELARERFAMFARVAQAYSDQIDGLVQLYGSFIQHKGNLRSGDLRLALAKPGVVGRG